MLVHDLSTPSSGTGVGGGVGGMKGGAADVDSVDTSFVSSDLGTQSKHTLVPHPLRYCRFTDSAGQNVLLMLCLTKYPYFPKQEELTENDVVIADTES